MPSLIITSFQRSWSEKTCDPSSCWNSSHKVLSSL